jgi:hypothetical protein
LKLPPQERLDVVYNIASKIRVCCEGDLQRDVKDREPIPHEGCGSDQPKISRDGMKLTVKYDKAVEGIEQKKELTAGEVCTRLSSVISFYLI